MAVGGEPLLDGMAWSSLRDLTVGFMNVITTVSFDCKSNLADRAI